METQTKNTGLAGLGVILACGACCALPLLGALGLSGVLTTLSSLIRPSLGLLVGGTLLLLGAGALFVHRARKRAADGCATSCDVDGGCCGPTAEKRP